MVHTHAPEKAITSKDKRKIAPVSMLASVVADPARELFSFLQAS